MADIACKEEYTYQVGKITFIVTPVYKDEGEPMRDILLKLMLADLESAGCSIDILNIGGRARYNIGRIKHLA